jgi:hypothetical protein
MFVASGETVVRQTVRTLEAGEEFLVAGESSGYTRYLVGATATFR